MQARQRVVGLDYDLRHAALPQKRPTTQKGRKVSSSTKAGYEKNVQSLFNYFAVVFLCLVILLGQGVYINNQGMEIGKINSTIEQFKLENSKKIIAIANLSSLENVEKVAVNDYNMVRAETVHYLIR